MSTHESRKTRKALIIIGIAAAAFTTGCSTDSASRKSTSAAASNEVGHMTTAEVRKDPDRIICRRHKPTGSRISEKICMTARQWQQASDESRRTLDKAQRTTGGTTGGQ